MEVTFTLSIGFPTAKRVEVIEFDDDITEEELEEAWQDWANGYIDGGWLKNEEI